ncbi:MAG: ParB/RepB/Spo0J family partition protein [Syntrophorhabdales bacterium]|jgi:ParB/RepB/Spo0J family partition protein
MLTTIPLKLIYANPNQPRKAFDPEKLQELAASIKEYGVLEPIVVTPRENGRYMIIAGERRFRASTLAGLPEIPVRVIEADDNIVEELALLENVQREDLTIIEEARAYQSLLDRGMSKEELATKLGKMPWRIDERTSLLNLSPAHQKLVEAGKIGHSEAFEMSRVSEGKQALILRKIHAGELGTYNKLRSFVDGMILCERQEAIFSLQEFTPEEKASIDLFKLTMRNIQSFVSQVENEEAMKKAAFHSAVRAEQLDLVIKHLMRLRKLVLAGSGIKEAMEAA